MRDICRHSPLLCQHDAQPKGNVRICAALLTRFHTIRRRHVLWHCVLQTNTILTLYGQDRFVHVTFHQFHWTELLSVAAYADFPMLQRRVEQRMDLEGQRPMNGCLAWSSESRQHLVVPTAYPPSISRLPRWQEGSRTSPISYEKCNPSKGSLSQHTGSQGITKGCTHFSDGIRARWLRSGEDEFALVRARERMPCWYRPLVQLGTEHLTIVGMVETPDVSQPAPLQTLFGWHIMAWLL